MLTIIQLHITYYYIASLVRRQKGERYNSDFFIIFAKQNEIEFDINITTANLLEVIENNNKQQQNQNPPKIGGD